jgi:hypothetical protein
MLKYILFATFFAFISSGSAQVLDLDLECPLVFPRHYFEQNLISRFTITQSGKSAKHNKKKHANASITYYFDSAGTAFMKVLHDQGDYTDTNMMNAMRCASKSDPESRFYEENLFCNDRGMILANQTEKSNLFYRYDSLDRLREWIQIDHEQDDESQVFLTKFEYDSIGRLDSVIDKEGALVFNLSIRQTDTIYRSATYKKVVYKEDRITSVLCYASNNYDQIVPFSVYKYKYKGDRLDMVELLLADDKKTVQYTLKVLWVE